MTRVSKETSDCQICGHFMRLGHEETIWRDESWIASSVFNVPGWTLVATLRHADGCWGLSDAEAASFGQVMRALGGAIKTITGAERVHMLAQGEYALHFHYLLVPRLPGEQPVFDGAQLAQRAETISDSAKAVEVAKHISDLVRETAPALASEP